MRVLRIMSVAGLVPLLCAVAPRAVQAQDTTTAAGQPKMKPPAKPKGRANLITEEEITASATGLQNAYLIVQRLRPAMLRSRSGSMNASTDNTMTSVDPTAIAVYLDNQSMGGVESLREINSAVIKEIRYLSASDATTLFGTGNAAGAIQVITKR